jgi:hypothetical protein
VTKVSQSFSCFFVEVILSFQFKVAAKVKPAHLFILCQFLSCAMLKDLSFNQQVSPVANRKGFIYIMISDQNTDIPVFKACDYCLYVFNRNRVNTSKRFIKQYEFRINARALAISVLLLSPPLNESPLFFLT